MTPFRFGEPSRQLSGIYHPPASGAMRGHCVVICNPFGQEAIRAHRLLRVIAERLSRLGFPVLRFDYFGTGDSDGADSAGLLTDWVDDVLRADLEARRLSGNPRSVWFGLRFGATLAALASAKAHAALQRLVLWNPVVEGAAYLEELAQAHDAQMSMLRLPNPNALAGSDGDTEALGFPITRGLGEEIRGLSGGSLFEASRAQSVILIASSGYAELAILQNNPALKHVVRVREIDTQIFWASDEAMNTAIVPAEALRVVLESVSQEP